MIDKHELNVLITGAITEFYEDRRYNPSKDILEWTEEEVTFESKNEEGLPMGKEIIKYHQRELRLVEYLLCLDWNPNDLFLTIKTQKLNNSSDYPGNLNKAVRFLIEEEFQAIVDNFPTSNKDRYDYLLNCEEKINFKIDALNEVEDELKLQLMTEISRLFSEYQPFKEILEVRQAYYNSPYGKILINGNKTYLATLLGMLINSSILDTHSPISSTTQKLICTHFENYFACKHKNGNIEPIENLYDLTRKRISGMNNDEQDACRVKDEIIQKLTNW